MSKEWKIRDCQKRSWKQGWKGNVREGDQGPLGLTA